jgi:hypothetical protein
MAALYWKKLHESIHHMVVATHGAHVNATVLVFKSEKRDAT